MPFDGLSDFSPITVLAYVTNTMVMHPSIPATSVREFIDCSKANPRKIAYASAGAGSTNHLCGALFEKMAQVSMVHVPYRGGAPAVADTVAGQTQLMFTAGTQSLEHVKAGNLHLLAVTEGKRSSLLPTFRPWEKPSPASRWPSGTAPTVPPACQRRLSRDLMPRLAAFCSCPR